MIYWILFVVVKKLSILYPQYILVFKKVIHIVFALWKTIVNSFFWVIKTSFKKKFCIEIMQNFVGEMLFFLFAGF